MKLILFFLISTIAQAALNLPPVNSENAYFRHQNRLTNPGFELGTTGWTRSGSSTFQVGTTASEIYSGRYGEWNPSATGEFLTSNTWTVNSSGAGILLAECQAKAINSGYTMQIYNSTDARVLAEVAVTVSDGTSHPSRPTSVSVPILPNGASKNIVLRFASSGDHDQIYIDDCFLGYTKESALASSIQDWTTYTPTFTGFGTVTVQNFRYAVVGGMLFIQGRFTSGTPTTTEARISFPSPYTSISSITTLELVGMAYNSVAGPSGSARAYPVLIEPSVAYMTLGQEREASTTVALQKRNGDDLTANGTVVSLFAVFPITGSRVVEAYTGQQLDWRVDANISGANPSLGTSSVSTYTGIEDASLTLTNNTTNQGSIPNVFIPCSSTNDSTGTTCSVGNESVGIAFTPPRAGWVQVCAAFTHRLVTGATGSISSTFQIVKTPNAAQTISEEGQERSLSRNSIASTTISIPHKNCAKFYLDSVSKQTFRLFYEQATTATVTSNVINADADAALGQIDIHWSVIPLSSYVAPPVSLGNVNTTPLANGQVLPQIKLVSALVSSASPGVVSREYGDWINGNCTRSGTSNHIATCTFETGFFTVAPNCFVSVNGTFDSRNIRVNSTSTNVVIRTYDGGSFEANEFTVMCQGY